MVFPKILRVSKCHQVSRTLLSNLVDINTVEIWLVCIPPLISSYFSYLSNPFQGFKLQLISPPLSYSKTPPSLTTSKYLLIFSPSFIFIPWSGWMSKSTRWRDLSFFLIKTKQSLIFWPIFDGAFLYQSPILLPSCRIFYTSSNLCFFFFFCYGSLSASKSPLISRTLLSILDDFSAVIVCDVLTQVQTSDFSLKFDHVFWPLRSWF